MLNTRIIARLDIKGPNLIKGIRFEGVRVLGAPQEFAQKYYQEGIDEIIYMDTVASLYGRNSLGDLVARTAKHTFIPITVGGGIRSTDDAAMLLRSGADKVAVNTAAVRRPELISEIARRFGSQCMVLSIEAKRQPAGFWEAYTDNGREHSDFDVVEWAKRGVELGAGEIFLTSVDKDGTKTGFDLDLVRAVTSAVPIPVIAGGGLGSNDQFIEAVKNTKADAVAVGASLHYNNITIAGLRQAARESGIYVRKTTSHTH